MWLKLCSLLFCATVLVGGNEHPPHTYPANSPSYDFDQIVNKIKLSLTCLEETPELSANATYQVAGALGELYYISHTVPGLDPERRSILDGVIGRFDAFLQRGLKAFPDLLDAQLLWYPQFWGLVGDFRFENGRIPSEPEMLKSLSEIYERSASTEEGLKCYNDLVSENLGSPIRRECTSPCEDKVSSTYLEGGLVPEDRWNYIFTEQLLNCTTNTPEKTFAKIEYVCKYAKLETDRMFTLRTENQFADIYYYFLTKVQFCGTMGFSEFYNLNFVSMLMYSIGTEGCVKIDRMTNESRQVMTVQTAAIFSSVLRFILEEEYRTPKMPSVLLI